MGKGKAGCNCEALKKPTAITKIIAFGCALGAFIAYQVGIGVWKEDVNIFFCVACIIGFGYAAIILICAVFDLAEADGQNWDTVICICISILSFIAAAYYAFAISKVKTGKTGKTKQSKYLLSATILEFLAAFAFLIDAILAIMEIGGK